MNRTVLKLIEFELKLGKTFSELSEVLNMPEGDNYYTGIKRDPNNKQIWRRISDSVEIKLGGWYKGNPRDEDGKDYLMWRFQNCSNEIWNHYEVTRSAGCYFVCEY